MQYKKNISFFSWKQYKWFILITSLSFCLLVFLFILFFMTNNNIINLLTGFSANITFGAIISWFVQYLNDRKETLKDNKIYTKIQKLTLDKFLKDCTSFLADSYFIEKEIQDIIGKKHLKVFYDIDNNIIDTKRYETNIKFCKHLLKSTKNNDKFFKLNA